MNKLFTSILALSLGFTGFGQVIFESDLSSWTAGDPDGFMGVKTNIGSGNVTEQPFGAEHGTSLAQLINTSGSHKRFTTENLTVTPGETYEIKIWMTGMEGSELRTGFYNPYVEPDVGYIYNTYFDVFAETGGAITMLSQTVVIPADCPDGEFIFSVKNTDDLIGIGIDSVSIGIGEPVEIEEVSIYDIQYSTEAPYISPYEGTLIKTTGIVTGVFATGADAGKFFIQDGTGAWNGVYVYGDGSDLNLGDEVTVTAEVSEFYELTELTGIIELVVESTGNPQPAAVDVSTLEAANEEYEGVLVRVMDAECVNDDAGYGQFEVNDGSAIRLIDDEIYSYTATIGNYYNITGVTFLSFDEVKIFPRIMEDIEVTGVSAINEDEQLFSIYPNPATDIVRFNVSSTATVNIYSISGELVYSANGNVQTVDISNFNAGVYQIIVLDNEQTSNQRLIVR